MTQVTYATSASFDTEVLKSSTPVLVDFYADWCGPCRALSPLLTKMASEFAGQVKVVKLNVDDSSDIAARYSVDSIPTLLFVSGGQVVQKAAGLPSEASLRKSLAQLAGANSLERRAS